METYRKNAIEFLFNLFLSLLAVWVLSFSTLSIGFGLAPEEASQWGIIVVMLAMLFVYLTGHAKKMKKKRRV